MKVAGENFRSEFGWSISLPKGWEHLQTAGDSDPLAIAPPVVFACSEDLSLSLTWMVEPYPSEPEVVEAFRSAAMREGQITPDEAETIVQHIWPLLGEVTGAEVVQLPDGRRAIETLEEFHFGPEPKNGYQLVFLIDTGSDSPAHFQRLCFYAPNASFSDHIEDIRESSHSFRYDRAFGDKSDTAIT